MKFIRTWLGAALVGVSYAAHAADLRVVQVAPLSGLEATLGRAYAAGMRLYFSATNKAGGVNGNSLELVTADDQGRPEFTARLTDELVSQNKPLLLAGYFGTANLATLVRSGVLERNKLPLMGYRQSDLRVDAPYLYSTRAMLDDEIRKFTEHLGTLGIKRIGLFYEDGAGAQRVIAYTEQEAAAKGLEVIARGSYPAGTVRVNVAADSLAQASPQAVLLVASGAAAGAFIEQFRAAGGTSQLFVSSTADIEQLAKRLGEEQMQGVVIAQVTPNPYKVTNRIGKEFNDLAAQAGADAPPVSYASMEGFITAKVIVAALRHTSGVPSRDAFMKALEKMDYLDLGGYAVGYGPGKRAGSRWVELTIVTSGGKIRQ